MESVISDDNEKTLSKTDLNEAIIEAEKRMARKKAGNIAGVFACVFGGLGIFTFGLLFVPLAFITAAIGFIRATIGRNGGGQAINVIAILLAVVGAILSPTIWLLSGTAISAYDAYTEKAKEATLVQAIPSLKSHTSEPPLAMNGDFRQFSWGESMDYVKQHHQGKLEEQSKNSLIYEGNIDGIRCSIVYGFSDNKLYMAAYSSKETHFNKNDYINDYDKLNARLTEKYGKPDSEKIIWKNDLFKGDEQDRGIAIATGGLVYAAMWTIEGATIVSGLAGDNLKIKHAIIYENIALKKEHEQREQAATIDLL
jgi:hypothetical protein